MAAVELVIPAHDVARLVATVLMGEPVTIARLPAGAILSQIFERNDGALVVQYTTRDEATISVGILPRER